MGKRKKIRKINRKINKLKDKSDGLQDGLDKKAFVKELESISTEWHCYQFDEVHGVGVRDETYNRVHVSVHCDDIRYNKTYGDAAKLANIVNLCHKYNNQLVDRLNVRQARQEDDDCTVDVAKAIHDGHMAYIHSRSIFDDDDDGF